MRGEAAWQFDLRRPGVEDPGTPVIVPGGRWRMDLDLPSADSLAAGGRPARQAAENRALIHHTSKETT
ncbi:MAG: hypothetical protein WCI19_03645 [Betaproteobacteria bacterium]